MSWIDPYDAGQQAYEDAAADEAYYAERDRELEEEYEQRQRQRDAEFDRQLDLYQERQAELAAESEALGDEQAVRAEASRLTVTFGDLLDGDYMTAEDTPEARWVKVVRIEPDRRKYSDAEAAGWVTVTFETPQPIGVGMETRWVIEREVGTPVVIDQRVRDEKASAA
jgi:hypothetical protein